MKQVPAPALKVTMQLVDPTLTVTISPLGTVSPLPVFTLTENTADDSAPDVTLLGDTVTLVDVYKRQTIIGGVSGKQRSTNSWLGPRQLT